MKKTLVVLLILAVAGGAFAQEVTFSGEVLAGVKVLIPGDNSSSGADNAIFYGDDNDDDRGLKARFNVDVDGENYGLQFGLQANRRNWANDNPGVDDYFSLYNAHGWSTIMDMATIRAGLIDPNAWGVGGWIDDNVDAGFGVRFEVHPIDGLNVGVFIPARLDVVEFGDAFQGLSNSQGFAAGFKYEQEDFFEVSASFGLYGFGSADDADAKLLFGAGYYGMPGLGIYVGLSVEDLMGNADPDENPTIKIGLNVDYAVMPALDAGLVVGVTLYDGLKEIEIKPWLEYAVAEDFIVGLDIPVTLAEDTSEDFGFAGVDLNLWGKYLIGQSYIKFGYGFEMLTENYGDNFDNYVGLWFGYKF